MISARMLPVTRIGNALRVLSQSAFGWAKLSAFGESMSTLKAAIPPQLFFFGLNASSTCLLIDL